MRKKRVSFLTTKKSQKIIVVKFRRADGSIAKFKAIKIVKKPKKVIFYAKRKKNR